MLFITKAGNSTMVSERIPSILASLRQKHSSNEARSAVNLAVFQMIYFVLIAATMVLCLFVDRGGRLAFYLFLLGALLVTDVTALMLNWRGRYRVSTWLTALCMVFGPWLSILLDPTVLAGDFVPLIYIGMSIQLCSILLSERVTLVLSGVQLFGVIAVILASSGLRRINWPSLVAFIVFTSVIGVLYGFTNKRQLTEIEKQRNQLQESEAKLKYLSIRDPLTGLFNRRYMEETFDREIHRAIRMGKQLSVIMADIDGFKNVNDNIGHVVGDRVLAKVSALLMKGIRASDVACRFGGDEFCLILPDCSMEEGIQRADSLRLAMEKLTFDPAEEGVQHITMSFGVATLPANGITREELIQTADNALYFAKKSGKNRVNGGRVNSEE